MLFGDVIGSVAFGSPSRFYELLPISWKEICPSTAKTENFDIVNISGYIQTVDNLWVLQDRNTVGSFIRRCI